MSKEDVIEIEGIVREAMPNAIFKVEMLSEDKNTGKLAPSGHILLAHWEQASRCSCPRSTFPP